MKSTSPLDNNKILLVSAASGYKNWTGKPRGTKTTWNMIFFQNVNSECKMSNKEISEILDIEKSYQDPGSYTLLRGCPR